MASLQILIADDHDLFRSSLRSLLASREDWHVCGEAADGKEAVEQAKRLKPDVVLLDVSMPEMNGLDAARVIRRDTPACDILIVSQNEPLAMQKLALQAGAKGYIQKSRVSHDLIKAIEALSGKRALVDAPHSKSSEVVRKADLNCLAGGGEMGAVMRSTNWSKTPLGALATWSPALRMMVKFLLANRFPQLLWWGPQFCSLYNDAYAPILGAKHPWAIGQPVREVWHEIWHILKPLIETPFHGGPATWMEDIPLEINRRGLVEETHFTIAYSPVPDETVPSGIGGVLATVHEITEKVVGERRVVALRDLGARSVQPKSAEEACTIAAETLGRHSKDVPFVLFYLFGAQREAAHLVCGAGIDLNDSGCPRTMDVASKALREVWPISKALETEEIQLVPDLKDRFQNVPQGPWSDPPSTAAVVPVRSNISHQLAGFMIVGISSRLQFDESYRNFLELMSTQIATSIANARAYEEERKRAEALVEIDRVQNCLFQQRQPRISYPAYPHAGAARRPAGPRRCPGRRRTQPALGDPSEWTPAVEAREYAFGLLSH